MSRLFLVILAVLCFGNSRALPAEALSISDATASKQLDVSMTGNGRDSASLKLSNLTEAPLPIRIPAGTILSNPANTEQQLVLRTLSVEIPPKSVTDAVLPTSALSSKNTGNQRPLQIVPNSVEPRLSKLTEIFDKQNDLPRPTAQLATFVLLQDITWKDWEKWLGAPLGLDKPPKPHPTPVEIAQAVDAVAFVRLIQPDKSAALLSDPDFKRLALRNPWARSKAMLLYGITVEDAVTGEASAPPDLSKLLHTAPNDNCPYCRQRAKAPIDIP